ncbi:MAG: hypothetical protein FWG04_01140 [Desulfovibrionaceae bacterium]|nr:hypothetical protein [Desulfovibrionaceae bacterium]
MRSLISKVLRKRFRNSCRLDAAKRNAVRKILGQAESMRCNMAVRFTGDSHTGRYSGPCMYIDSNSMGVNIGQVSQSEFPTEMTGSEVSVHFSIANADTSRASHYQFRTRICGMRRKNGTFELILNIPETLDNGERRNFFRVSPFPEHVYALRIWMLKDENSPPTTPAELAPSEWSESIHARSMPISSLVNISAGGLGLLISHEENSLISSAQVKDRVLCFLALHPLKGAHPSAFWLDCEVANRSAERNASCTGLGLRFNAWALPGPDEQMQDWRLVDKQEGITSLANWVLKQQLAQRALKKKTCSVQCPAKFSI